MTTLRRYWIPAALVAAIPWGPVPDPGLSTLEAWPAHMLADGFQSATITVTVRDAAGEPLPGFMVEVAATGSGNSLVQPSQPTDGGGVAVARLASTVAEVKTVTAKVLLDPEPDVWIEGSVDVQFVSVQTVPANVLVVLMDDVGTDFLSMYDELNPYRSDLPYEHGVVGAGDEPGNGPGTSNLYVHAPTLTGLAESGVMFLNAYTHPRCSPTRAALLTGHHPSRTGVGDVIFGAPDTGGALKEMGDPGFELTTLPERLRLASYSDGFVGKWHLARGRKDMDPVFGDDRFRGWASIPERGGWSLWRAVFAGLTDPPAPSQGSGYYSFYWNRDHVEHAAVLADPQGHQTTFSTTVEVDEALSFCATAPEPFVCVLATHSAHAPWNELPPPHLTTTDEYMEGPGNAFTRYAALLESLDAELGRLLAELDPARLARTVVIVMGDNGTPQIVVEHARIEGTVTGGGIGSGKDLGATYDFLLDAPLPRFKSSVNEKGVRVPLIVSGPGVVSPGRSSLALVQVEDVLATALELAGLPPDGEMDGISFAPVLRDEVGHSDHARDHVWSELFWPHGLVEPRADPTTRWIGCSLRIPGSGRFKIVRDAVRGADFFYQLQDADGAFVDPFETQPLPFDPGAPQRSAYELVSARIGQILARAKTAGPPPGSEATVLCSCDGQGAPAPCGNLGHTGRGCANSVQVLGARLRPLGSVSLADGDFALRGSELPAGTPTLFFQGTQLVQGGAGAPFGDGLKCAGGTIMRILTGATSSLGVLESPSDLGAFLGVQPGDVRVYQAWYRDVQGPCGTGYSLTNALQVVWEP